MKILLLTTHLNLGGISTYVVTLAKYLKLKGVDVIVASSGGSMLAELDKAGVSHYFLNIRTKNEISPKLFLSMPRLLEIVEDEGVTHIHSHTRIAQVLGLLTAKMKNIHYVSTCHGFYKRRIGRLFLPAWGERVVAISDPVREHLVNKFKVNKSKIKLIYNGVEPDKFMARVTDRDKEEIRRYFNVEDGGNVVGGVSRLEKVKGYQYLIRAIPYILKECPDTKFILVGDGTYRKKLVRLAERLGVEDKIVFTGKVEDVDIILGLIDIFVHPAIWEEGFGLAVLEAMAAGKPILASNTGGVYALVKDGVNGWLLKPKSIDEIAINVVKMIKESALMKKMGESSREFAVSKFSMSRMADEMISLYRELN